MIELGRRPNRDRIFPTEPDKDIYFRAAWSAYIQFSDVYTNVFPELMDLYRKSLEELPYQEKRSAWSRLDERLATHLLKAYLVEMIDLDSPDQLLLLYYERSDDEIRSNGNFWLSKVLEAQRPQVK